MDLDIRWDVQQTGVIVMKYDQAANWDEVLEVFETQAHMAAQVTHPVAVIILQHERIHLPGGDWMAVGRQIKRGMPDNVKIWVAVGVNRTLQAVIEVARRAGIINMYAAASIDAAREMAAAALAKLEAEVSNQP